MITTNEEAYVPEGLDNFYQYMSLFDEVKVMPTKAEGATIPSELAGTPNWVTIEHHSNIFPNLRMEGFFDPAGPLEFSEKADDAPLVTWTHTFFIHRSVPSFNTAAFEQMKGMFVEGITALNRRG